MTDHDVSEAYVRKDACLDRAKALLATGDSASRVDVAKHGRFDRAWIACRASRDKAAPNGLNYLG